MEVGGPQKGVVTCGGSAYLSYKRDRMKMRDYVNRRLTHQSALPHLPGVPHLHVEQALTYRLEFSNFAACISITFFRISFLVSFFIPFK